MVGLRLLSIIRKEFTQIWRDTRTLALIVVMPIMQMLLMGYAATRNVRNGPMAVFDHAARAVGFLEDRKEVRFVTLSADSLKIHTRHKSDAKQLESLLDEG